MFWWKVIENGLAGVVALVFEVAKTSEPIRIPSKLNKLNMAYLDKQICEET